MHLLAYIPGDDKIKIMLPLKYKSNEGVKKLEHVYGK